MNKDNICIVIPIYKKSITQYEELSIQRIKEALSDYDIYFVTFKDLDLLLYKKFSPVKIHYFPRKYFCNVQSYSRLLLSPLFYLKFIRYRYMCIIQPDALILGTGKQLEDWANLQYDYVGAPWKKSIFLHRFEPGDHFWILELFPGIKEKLMGNGSWCHVGNGGLSLRNIRSTIKLLLRHVISRLCWYENEDLFFSYFGIHDKKGYRLPSRELAKQFAVETTARADLEKGIRPFGVHAWEKYCPDLLQRFHIK